jgi:hypothetical protein
MTKPLSTATLTLCACAFAISSTACMGPPPDPERGEGLAESTADALKSPESPAADEQPTHVTLKTETCDSSSPVTIPLGSTLTIDAPLNSKVTWSLGLYGDVLPHAQVVEGRRVLRTYELSSERPEVYRKRGRFLLESTEGSYWSAQCIVDVTDSRWTRVWGNDFFAMGTPGSFTERTHDLGVIARGMGLIVTVSSNNGPGIVETDATPEHRVTVAGVGFPETSWVFEGLSKGEYSVDVDMAFPEYGRTRTRLFFAFE